MPRSEASQMRSSGPSRIFASMLYPVIKHFDRPSYPHSLQTRAHQYAIALEKKKKQNLDEVTEPIILGNTQVQMYKPDEATAAKVSSAFLTRSSRQNGTGDAALWYVAEDIGVIQGTKAAIDGTFRIIEDVLNRDEPLPDPADVTYGYQPQKSPKYIYERCIEQQLGARRITKQYTRRVKYLGVAFITDPSLQELGPDDVGIAQFAIVRYGHAPKYSYAEGTRFNLYEQQKETFLQEVADEMQQFGTRESEISRSIHAGVQQCMDSSLQPEERGNGWKHALSLIPQKAIFLRQLRGNMRASVSGEDTISRTSNDAQWLANISPTIQSLVNANTIYDRAGFAIAEYTIRHSNQNLTDEEQGALARAFPPRIDGEDFEAYKGRVEMQPTDNLVPGRNTADNWIMRREVLDVLEIAEQMEQQIRATIQNRTIEMRSFIGTASDALRTVHTLASADGLRQMLQRDMVHCPSSN